MRSVFIGALAAVVLGAAAHADPIGDCAQVQPADARLACYDKAAAAAAARSSQTPAPAEAPAIAPPNPSVAPPQAATPPSPPAKKKGGALFGLFGGSKEQPSSTAGSATPAAPATAPTQPPASDAKTDVDKFGAPEKKEPEKHELKKITAQITSWEYVGFNRHIVVHLDNGQVWRQLNNDYANFELSKSKTYIATISRGLFGSYNLEISGFHKMAKVERIQ